MLIKKSNKKQAFTLVELMIVISIIGILAALAMPNIKYARDRARESKCFEYSSLLSRTAEVYYIEKKDYPKKLEDLDPFLGSGKKNIKCPSGGQYLHLTGSGEGDSTFIYYCSPFHSFNKKAFGSAL